MPGINVAPCGRTTAARPAAAPVVDPKRQFPWIGRSTQSGKVILFTHFENGWFKGVMLCNSTGRKTPAGQMAETQKPHLFNIVQNATVAVTGL